MKKICRPQKKGADVARLDICQTEANKVVSLGVIAPWGFLTIKFLERTYSLYL